MHPRKRFTVLRPALSPRNLNGSVALTLFLLMASSALAQRLPLPPNEQEEVNNAIDRGVTYLKRTQQKNGTWANPRGNYKEATIPWHGGHVYAIGFTALPALTLLECGLPPSDPIIQQAAQFVRSKSAQLDRTYELSLAILFLDRLGDPKDTKIIQTFALRLIAGQSATGGWGYKCPMLGAKTQMDLLTALRHLDPPDDMPRMVERRKKPGDLKPTARVPGGPMLDRALVQPDAPSLDRTVVQRGGPSMEGSIVRPGTLPLDGTIKQPESPPLSSSIRQDNLSEPPSLSGTWVESKRDESTAQDESIDIPVDRWRDCLGWRFVDEKRPELLEPDPKEKAAGKPSLAKPDGKAGNNKSSDLKTDSRKTTKQYVIPDRIKMLPVIQEPGMHVLQDPLGRGEAPFLTTTDNSNTQFAILALWRSQQYEVPTKRSLNLIARRYLTSQNADGSWGYHYQFGGGGAPILLPNAMTCVGLIGLAVGHGLAQLKPAGQPVQDARIVNGLISLSGSIGQPVENRGKLNMQSLYFLWSLERVAVLYNLPTIGEKDWYRWGAQILVRNQANEGNWAGGLYVGSCPPLDTCLALLFLKRANLVKDLTAKLPFSAEDLNKSIMEKLAPSSNATELPKRTKETKRPIEPPKATEPEVVAADSPPAPVKTVETENTDTNTGNSKTKWIVLFAAIFLIFAAGSLAFILLALNRRAEMEGEEKQSKRTKRSVNPDSKASAVSRSAKR